ncbi:MAG: helix-turn-helix transcriptional regulator [Oscillospiraceae bacterium]|nr:helix-turn-helix transcriptional regulator [Oscillospiraceae bacterium]
MAKRPEPLTESYFYILLCLYNGPNHGYGIMQQVLTLSDGHVRIGSGTMYGAVSAMLTRGWIAERLPDSRSFERKRQYELTDAGRQVLEEEISRLNHLTRIAAAVTGAEKGDDHEQ